jgi:eukaryotic-like serine/threonine-protein kinase
MNSDLMAIDPKQFLGRVIAGKMTLLELLGEGAMGCVFRAHHRALDKTVAIKIMKRTHRADLGARFAREAQVTASFDHPNSVQILDFGEDGDDKLLYIAMEYLQGRNLFQALHQDGPFGGRRLSEIMVQVLGALAAAHDQGVIHRDIKTANIMLIKKPNDDGELVEIVKVCDFGLAKMLNLDGGATLEGAAQTAAGVIVGTPAYMSPEQAVNERIDERTDVYACGIVMYEMLTGRVPFDAPTQMGVLFKHVSEPPILPSEIVPTISPELESIVMWTLEKQHARRCPSARELRRALKDYLAGISSVSGPVTGPMEIPAELRRTRTPALAPSSALPLPSGAIIGALSPATLASSDAAAPVVRPIPENGAPAARVSGSATEALPLDAIIGPALGTGDLSPIAEQGNLDDLVAQAVGEPAVVESSSDLDDSGPKTSVDYRRHAAALSDRAQYMWKHYGIMFEPYQGANPFWACDHNEKVLGPCQYADIIGIIKKEGEAGNSAKISLSADGKTWMRADTFVRLTGQEALLHGVAPAEKARRSAPSGAIGGPSAITGLFGRLARERPTGRLSFTNGDPFAESTQAEIHLVNGKPTFVFVTDPALQLPELLVKKGLVDQKLIPGIVHLVLAEERTLEDVVERRTLIDVRSYRATFMKDRLLCIYNWKKGSYSFNPDALPASAHPFAPSLLALLPEFVYRSVNVGELSHSVWRYAELKLPRSERLGTAIGEMGLTDSQLQIVKRLTKGPTIAEALRKCEPKEEKMYLTMAYILLECDLLLRPI